ncbi:hypothetical protein EDB92DRAFT_989507 [Lactarius akahatsu]|uniref:Uncharacterized protein n=1 Tax=Lactarius akahatsu TaxID=416441 RepID=A0AAD4LES6_9AGAM|nr:hypothetical protein EDB92DRAFT_989507 [Lactarius akahatsu]
MSPYRPANQRRRSLSVSTSPFHDQHAIDSCLPSKRTLSRKDIPRQWDLDSWRRGKRPRTQRFSPLPTSPNHNDLTQAPATTVDVTSFRFPSTSTAFELRPRNPPPSYSPSRHRLDSHLIIPAQDISALHSSAFGELHQSIIEASEGFVQRMRDWESSRPQGSRQNYRLGTPFPSYVAPRGRESAPRKFSSPETTSGDDAFDSGNDDDDDDDVLILSDETSSEVRAASPGAVSPPKKRARSLGEMDLDSPQAAHSILPELSHTVASSSTSSLLSLSPSVILPPSTREEKAIAALTLALANGAAGINDYSAVREALGASAALAEGASEVGEMWR